MMTRVFLVVSILSMLVVCFPAAAAAQFSEFGMAMMDSGSGEAMIAGSGAVILQRPATAFRMYVELVGKGKTAEEAVAKLKDRRAAALAQLEKLKAAKESIIVGTPAFSTMQADRQRQMAQMISQRVRAGGRVAAKPLKLPETIVVVSTLTVEWPLPATSPEAALVAAKALEDKLKAADLGGSKDAEKLSPEEQELNEEMASEMSGSSDEQPQPGTPQFCYVARISPQDREKAMAEAFQKARADALRLAKAAGVELGPLKGVFGGSTGRSDMGEGYYGSYGPRAALQQLMALRAAGAPDADEDESLSPQPNALGFHFQVRASFAMAKELAPKTAPQPKEPAPKKQ